jgi:hypothetical protein
MIRLEQRLEGQNQGQVEAQGTNQDTDRRHMVLEDRILELEQKLSKEKKKTSILKNAKDNVRSCLIAKRPNMLVCNDVYLI